MANGDYDLTHKKILESGKKIFKEQGFEKANLRAICKEAGVTTGAFYGHFEDKESLFAELVEPLIAEIKRYYAMYENKSFDAYKKELKSMYEDYTSYSLYQAMSAAKEFLCPNEANSADDDASNSTSEYTPDHKSAELPNIEDTYNPASDCILEPQSTELPDIEGTYTPAKDY